MRSARVWLGLALVLALALLARGPRGGSVRAPELPPARATSPAATEARAELEPAPAVPARAQAAPHVPPAGPAADEAEALEPAPLEPGGLRVRVLDARGAPAGGVPVALLRHVGGQGQDRVEVATTRVGDGRARLELAELLGLRARVEEAGLGLTFSVEAEVASATPVRVALASWPADGDELELALPAMGAARVRVLTRAGAPLASEASVAWWWVPADVAAADPGCAYERVPEHLVETHAGLATIERIGPGLALAFTASAPGFEPVYQRNLAGPRAAGEVVEHELRLGAPLATLALRVLDVAGAPLAGAKLQGELWLEPEAVPSPAAGPPRPEWLALECDADGRVRFPLAPGVRRAGPRLDLVRRSPTLDAERDPDWSATSVALPPVLAEGAQVDLGEVRLAPVPVLAEGCVRDEDGNPLPRATLGFLERFGSGPEHRWYNLRDGFHAAGADGCFRVRSPRHPRALALRVTAPGFVARTFEDLVPGAQGLELVLAREEPARPTGALRLRLELDPEVFPLALVLQLRSRAGGDTPDWWPGQVLELEGLAPGRYDVWVETREGDLELTRVTGVEVRAGEVGEDPRLQPLDLRGLARTVTLELVRPDGAPWRRSEVRIDPLEPRSDFHARTDDEGRTTLVLPRRITQLDVALAGQPPARVTLAPGPDALRVVLAGE